MKKRLLALFMTLVMVMSLVAVPAAAVEEDTQQPKVCPHCNVAWDDCNWLELLVEEPDVTIPSGHYFLSEDLNTVARYKIGTSDGQTADLGVDVCLDLRGYKLEQTTANRRAFYVYNYSRFSVMDSVGGGKMIGTGYTGSGGGAGGTIYVCKDGQLDLYSGALMSEQKNRTADGGVVYVSNGGTFNMYDGIVDASKVTVAVIEKDDANNVAGQYPRASAICASGTVNIFDGMVIGGSAYQGGTISVNPTGKLYIKGGTVMNGTTQSHGGSIYSQGLVEVSGGLLTGGYSRSGRGGNIYSSGTSAKLYIKGGVIENGQCSSGGGNVSAYSGVFEVTGGIIRGNTYASTNMTISGKPVIENYGYEGMTLASGKTLTVKDLVDGAKIVLWGVGAMTDATASPDVASYLEKGYLVPASRYDLQVVDGVLTGSQDDTGYCPHCEKEITWVPYAADINTSGHYYIPAGGVALPAGSAGLTVASGTDIVLNLAHGSAKPATPYQVAGTMTVLSTAGSVGRIYTSATSTSANGATFSVTGTLNLYDGILGASTASGVTTTGNGGVIYLNGGKLHMYGGWITGNTAACGGAVFLNGSKATVNMYNGVITGGAATTGGGNVYLNKGTFNMNGGMITGGNAPIGGNIYNYTSAKVNINDGIIALGTSTKNGGNLRHASTSSHTVMKNGVMYGGVAPEGGNAYINNGSFTVTGGSLINGIANGGNGGNIYAHAGSYYINKSMDPVENGNFTAVGDDNTGDDIAAPVIVGGHATALGGNIYVSGCMKLGKCTITGGFAKTGNEFYLGDVAYLTVEPGFTQDLIMSLDPARVAELDADRALKNTTCTTLNAAIYAENYDMARLMKNAAGQLGLAGASTVDVTAGTQEWYLTAQEAVDACTEDEYVRLYAPENTMQIKDHLVLDVNGTKASVSGSGKVYGFDTANDDYTVWGTVTLTGVTAEPVYQAPNGNHYVTVTDENGTGFHRLGIATSHVSLRASASGIYFKGRWNCDSVLQPKIKSFGVAVSTLDMPGTDFATDGDTLYTTFGADQFVSGQTMTSALIANILKEGEDNNERGTTAIYAAPYAVMTDGSIVVGDDGNKEKGGAVYSMQDVMATVNRIWPKLNDTQQATVKSFYDVDKTVMEGWGLYNITAAIKGIPSDRPLKILTLGHSLALDAGHMLNLVSAAEGYSEEFIIATLYYSGCPLYKHVNFLRSDSPEYSLYLSSTLTPDQPPVIQKSVTMKYAIEYDDWDIIVMQGGVFEIADDAKYKDGNIQIIQDYVNQHKTNPNAIFAWNSPWAPPTTNSLRDQYPYSPNSYYTSYAKYNDDRTTMYNSITKCLADNIVTDDSFIYLIPSCTAIENALSSYLEETDLHRDYVHMSDLGRVITSYTWYCTLAGVDELTEVQLDAIPKAFLKSTSDKTKDRVLTDAEKLIVIESVNNALANPLQMTQSVYTTAP